MHPAAISVIPVFQSLILFTYNSFWKMIVYFFFPPHYCIMISIFLFTEWVRFFFHTLNFCLPYQQIWQIKLIKINFWPELGQTISLHETCLAKIFFIFLCALIKVKLRLQIDGDLFYQLQSLCTVKKILWVINI